MEPEPLTGRDGKPEMCVSCKRPAVDYYYDDESYPSCGGLRCEFQMQQCMDYHEDIGDR